MIRIFHGDDEYSIAVAVARLRGDAVADAASDLNSTELDGRRLTVGELAEAASAMPFLADVRMVVVRGFAGRLDPRSDDDGRKELAPSLIAYLPGVPPTTELVFVDRQLAQNNPLLKWAAAEAVSGIQIRHFESPKAAQLPEWLSREARSRGGSIEARGAQALAEALDREGFVNLRVASSELDKLMIFADGRAVTAEDVRALTTPVGMESVFKLMDAIADRNGRTATSLLRRFMDSGEPPLRMLALVARQVRLLVMARELLDGGAAAGSLPTRLGVPGFVAQKLQRQSRRFTPAFLVAALRRLTEIDFEIKSGQVDAALALDVFVCELCGPAAKSRGA